MNDGYLLMNAEIIPPLLYQVFSSLIPMLLGLTHKFSQPIITGFAFQFLFSTSYIFKSFPCLARYFL